MSSCQRKYICPAYQSSFILDEDKTERFFALFGEDSLPKDDYFVHKDKTGIIEKMKRGQKQEEMSTVKMVTIYPAIDSALLASNDLYALNDNDVDSAFTSPPYHQRLKFNRDQEVYMKYIAPSYNWNEILPGERQAVEQNNEPQEEKTRRGLFRRKNKADEKDNKENEADQPIEGLEDF